MVSYIIVTRNPTSKRLIVIEDNDMDDMESSGTRCISEFDTEEKALKAAGSIRACCAWGAEIVPVDRE